MFVAAGVNTGCFTKHLWDKSTYRPNVKMKMKSSRFYQVLALRATNPSCGDAAVTL